MAQWEHLFECGCTHKTNLKRGLSPICARHYVRAIRLTKTEGDVVTVKTLDGRGVKQQCKQVSP